MADTIDIGGKPVKKQTVFIATGAVVILGVAVYRYRKQQSSATNAAAAAAAAAQAPGTGAGTSDQIDPATGFAYGSAEDAAALTAQSGYNSPFGVPSGTSYLVGGASSGFPGGGGFVSNAQWAQAAEDYLVNTAGADATTVGNALGKYITGGTLDATMTAIVNQAIAFEGYPPVGGPDGYPPSIRTAPVTVPPTGGGGGNGSTGTGTGTATVPNCVGNTAGTAHNKLVSAGFIPVADAGQKATSIVKSTKPAGGTLHPTGSVVLITT